MMTDATRQILDYLLIDLICAQDTVTHNNERGIEYVDQTRAAIAKRDVIKRQILTYCDGKIGDEAEVKALVDACSAFVEAWEKSHQLEKTDVALRMAKSALEPFTPPASPTPERTE